VHDVFADAVFDERRVVRDTEEPCVVGLVLAEERLERPFAVEPAPSEGGVRRDERRPPGDAVSHGDVRLRLLPAAMPGVAKPQRRKDVQRRRAVAPIADRDANEQVLGIALGVLHEDVEIPVLCKHAGVEQLVFAIEAGSVSIGGDQSLVGKFGLRIFVKIPHVRMRRRRIEIVVILFDVFAVIPFFVGQAEEPLFENGVAPVPQGDGETESLFGVGDSRQAVFAATVRPGARLIVAEMPPRVAGIAVILANRAPLAFAQVRPPFAPRNPCPRIVESLMFGGHRSPHQFSQLDSGVHPRRARRLFVNSQLHSTVSSKCD
jgi:hypothetical protein